MRSGSTKWAIGNSAANDSFKIINKAGVFDSTSYMTILSTGNFGIGTTAPTNKLDVNGLWLLELMRDQS